MSGRSSRVHDDELRRRLTRYAEEGGQPRRPAPSPSVLRRRGSRALVANATAVVLLVGLAGGGVVVWARGVRQPDRVVTQPTTAPPTTGRVGGPSVTNPTRPPEITSTTAAATAGPLTPDSRVTPTGMGPVQFGMTLREAEHAAARTLVPWGEQSPGCHYVAPKGWPKVRDRDLRVDPVLFMVTAGRVSRVDVMAGAVATSTGIGIGSTEQQVRQAYPGRITASRNLYGTRLLTFTPADATGSDARIVFETDGGKVTAFHAGKLPEVNRIEGCA
jgi:hypothetical protein